MKPIQTQLARIAAPAALLITGLAAHAQFNNNQNQGGGSGTIGGNISTFLTFVNGYLVPLIFAVAFLLFLWGVFRYFIAGSDSESRKEGRMFILYAVIGFFVMVSVWGLVNLLKDSVTFGNPNEPGLPTVNVGGGGSNNGTNLGGG